jgi:hypothetical protein
MLETGIDITASAAPTGDAGTPSTGTGTQTAEATFGVESSDMGQAFTGQSGTPSAQVEQAATPAADPNLTPDNLAAYRASLTQESQKLAAERAAFQAQAREAQIYREQAMAAQAVLQHPAIRQVLNQNIESIADAMISRGIVQPHEKAQLIAEIRKHPQVQQMQQAQVQQMQPAYQPQPDVASLVQSELKKYEDRRTVETQIQQVKEEYRQLYGREATDAEVQEHIQYAIQELVNNPLKHAMKVKHFEKLKADTIAQTRLQIMQDLRNGADPFGGAVLPVQESPEITQMKQGIRNAVI